MRAWLTKRDWSKVERRLAREEREAEAKQAAQSHRHKLSAELEARVRTFAESVRAELDAIQSLSRRPDLFEAGNTGFSYVEILGVRLPRIQEQAETLWADCQQLASNAERVPDATEGS